MSALEEIRNRFKKDRFATEAAGIVIDHAEPGKAVCSLTLEEKHMNENNVPMGGAVFTLADFTCAIASNGYSEKKTVSQQVIHYLSRAGEGQPSDRGGILSEGGAHHGVLCGGCEGRAGKLCGSCHDERIYYEVTDDI